MKHSHFMVQSEAELGEWGRCVPVCVRVVYIEDPWLGWNEGWGCGRVFRVQLMLRGQEV